MDAGSGDTQSGFELTFDVPAAIASCAHLFLATGGGAVGGVPLMRVVLIVTLNGRAEPIIDGVATDIEVAADGLRQSPNSSSRARTCRRSWTCTELPAIPYPGDAALGARAGDPREVHGVRRDSAGDSRAWSTSRRCPRNGFRSSRARTTVRPASLAREAGYVFYLEAGSHARHVARLLGTGDPHRHAAAGTDYRHGCASRNVDQLSFHFDREAKSIPVVFFHETAEPAVHRHSDSRTSRR